MRCQNEDCEAIICDQYTNAVPAYCLPCVNKIKQQAISIANDARGLMRQLDNGGRRIYLNKLQVKIAIRAIFRYVVNDSPSPEDRKAGEEVLEMLGINDEDDPPCEKRGHHSWQGDKTPCLDCGFVCVKHAWILVDMHIAECACGEKREGRQ